jgi:hypothetical protein
MINSVMDATINDIFVADIMRCYKTIPLKGDNNLLDAITFITRHAYKQAALVHPKAETLFWIRLDKNGTPSNS